MLQDKLQYIKEKWGAIPTLGKVTIVIATIVPLGFVILGAIVTINKLIRRK